MAMVCSCHVVSDRRINRTIDYGARSVSEVADACRAGSSCGGCHDAIEGLIEQRCGLPTYSSTPVRVRVA
jgi:bacterioferritin-associated ferredoxin